jgi:hypothetical protein
MGHVETVSRDRLVDEATKQPYFLAQVVAEDVPDDVREHLTAGMPADVVMPTGERTVLDYLVRPLKDRLRGGAAWTLIDVWRIRRWHASSANSGYAANY